jgi:hypothetical protein
VFLNEVKVCPELHTKEHVATPKVMQATTCLSTEKMEVCQLDEIVTNNVKFGDGPQPKKLTCWVRTAPTYMLRPPSSSSDVGLNLTHAMLLYKSKGGGGAPQNTSI